MRNDHGGLPVEQISHEGRQSIIAPFCPALLACDISLFDEADLGQPPAKCSHKVPRVGGRRVAQKPNHRHPLALLRTRRNRPGRRPAEQGDELATPHHSITSSARASSVGGTSRPSALAILRLITSSYLLGACTGRSAGFSPLRMRST